MVAATAHNISNDIKGNTPETVATWIAFEKYFIYNMKRGSTDPLFQKLALKVIGLNRLKD